MGREDFSCDDFNANEKYYSDGGHKRSHLIINDFSCSFAGSIGGTAGDDPSHG